MWHMGILFCYICILLHLVELGIDVSLLVKQKGELE